MTQMRCAKFWLVNKTINAEIRIKTLNIHEPIIVENNCFAANPTKIFGWALTYPVPVVLIVL